MEEGKRCVPRQAEVAQGVPGRLRPRIFLTTRVVGRQPNAPAAFTPREIPGTLRGWVDLGTHGSVGVPRKKSPVTPPGIDPGTVRLVAQCLNHYATPGRVVTFMSWRCTSGERTLSTHCIGSGRGGFLEPLWTLWGNNIYPLPGIKPLLIGCASHIVVTLPIELNRLRSNSREDSKL